LPRTLALSFAAMLPPGAVSSPFAARRLGTDAGCHFFGYYNKSPWDPAGTRVLAQRAAVGDGAYTPDRAVEVGYFDLERDGRFTVLGTTRAWNWQMGSQLQWLGGGGRRVIHNVRTADDRSPYPGFGARIHDPAGGAAHELPLPIYVVAPDGQYGLCVDYSRLFVTHPTIGYSGARSRYAHDHCPADDGIRRVDLASGESELVVSYRALRDFHPRASMQRAVHWVSHIEIDPTSSRVVLLHRWTERIEDETCFLHRLIGMNPDGTALRLLECSDHPLPQLDHAFDPAAAGTYDYEKSEYQISHPMWRDARSVIAWSPHAGRIAYHLYADADAGRVDTIGAGVLTENGHMSYSPVDARWLVSDTYPDPVTHERVLFLFDVEAGVRHALGSFYADPRLTKENRCDLHPRWSRDGRRLCIDSVHEGERQMYVVDVSTLTQPATHARQGGSP
jgi:hypothetical protein